ncbi:MAG: pentapeptide repeat-containing protein [Planctomycetota bacterium]|jgi:uncharacterized protein YjbI with pentapeptide repeats/cellulose biosynthesis protein BcsQ
MKILAITSGKGGVGKTTLSLNVARQLSLHGLRTLIVDFDIHNKGTTGMFLEKVSPSSPSIISTVEKSSKFDSALIKEITASIEPIPLVKDSSLLLLPAARPREMIHWSSFVATNDHIVVFFRQLFEQLTSLKGIDVVIIDCYGGIDSLTVAAAGIADDIIIVNEPDIITFSGTLLLYTYLADTYAKAERKPSIHFVINRITLRHSFYFLDKDYQKHLSDLSIRNSILAYFHYDKLVMETFGDYAFFTELLPGSLLTKKIKLLICQLWKEDAFQSILRVSEKKQKKIYRSTSENRFADPERIIRTAVSAPFWLMIPVAILTFLIAQPVESLPYRVIQLSLYLACLFVMVILFLEVIFEPIQITRWLLRNAHYNRRKNVLQKQTNKLFHYLNSTGAYYRAIIPAFLSFAIFIGIAFTIFNLDPWFYRDIRIWKGNISGFRSGGNYRGLRLSYRSQIVNDSTFKNVDLSHANLIAVNLSRVDFTTAILSNACLRGAVLSDANLSRADLTKALLKGADLSNANLAQSDLKGADLLNADLSHANLEGANMANIKNWQNIKSLQGANIFNVVNPPETFIDWAIQEKWAVYVKDPSIWKSIKQDVAFRDLWLNKFGLKFGRSFERRIRLLSQDEKLKEIEELERSLLEEEIKPHQFAALELLMKGTILVTEGKVKEAIKAYEIAQTIDPALEIPVGSWNRLGWYGSLWGYASDVLHACENAVKLDPNDGWIRDTRGLARALTKDYQGAIEDFRLYIEWGLDKQQHKDYLLKRRDWIRELKAGRNPFDKATLEKLRNE